MLGVDLSSGIFTTEADPISYNITYCTWYVQKIYLVWLFELISLNSAYLCWPLIQLMN